MSKLELQTGKKRSELVANALLWMLLALGVAGCKGDAKPTPKPALASVSIEMESLKNRSIALLENNAETDKEGKRIAEAVQGFQQVAQQVPDDPLGPQNLCVALLFQIRNEKLKPNPQTAAIEAEFSRAIEKLKLLTPDQPDAWVLESRFQQEKVNTAAAEKLLREATTKAGATADTFFQLVEFFQAAQSEPKLDEVRQLLESAISKSPSSIPLAVAYMDVLAKQQDAEAFAKQFSKVKEFVLPLTSRVGSPIPRLLDQTQKAVEASQWNVIQRQANFIRNVCLAEIAYQNDLNLLRPHTLEYIRLRFANAVASDGKSTAAPKFETATLGFELGKVDSIAAEDFDLDGRADLHVAKGKKFEVWTLSGSSPRKLSEVDLAASVTGIVLADLDHDYQVRKESLPQSALPTAAAPDAPVANPGMVDTDLDIILYGNQGLQLFENRLGEDKQTRSMVVRPLSDDLAALRQIRHVAVIDLDHDSDLDLIVASEGNGVTLWSNRGDWTFADFTGYSSLPDVSKLYDSVISWDADRNVLTDIFVGSDQLGLPIMLANNLHGRYQPRQLNWPKELQGASRVIEAIDANHDACWDLATAGEKGVRLLSMKSTGRHGWLPDSVMNLSDISTRGLTVCDLNNDGFSDILSWGESGLQFFLGNANGQLQNEKLISSPKGAIAQLLLLDIDADSDEDVIALDIEGNLSVLKNADGNQNQQLAIVLRADEDGSQRPRERCNMHGVGSTIELKSKTGYQSQVVRGTRTRFGLGVAKTADIVRIVWTNGTPNNLLNVNNSSTVFDQQRLNGSCPYLYVWNGDRFEFYTDCLWAAPIGLQFGPGVLASTRDWEYLKIDGSAIKPKDGNYVLQLTEELWEAAYFDAVELLAVDHSPEIEVYTNEKVGPPDIAENRIFTVRKRLEPRVTDQSGKDWSELTKSRDGRYTKTWTQGWNQGLTSPHWLEVDLNRASEGLGRSNSDEKVLFLSGWVFPTCTSLNMALAENPQRPEVQPPSIQVPDGLGNWIEVVPFCGFPGGKTKTIAIDLKGKFLCDDHRLRLVSNMELCWDEVFFTEGERQAETDSFVIRKLPLLKADLHYRGFSDQVIRSGNAPNYYDYNRVSQESIWAPMSGNFTRYGEVSNLLLQADDLQVVMGAGDEITLEFGEVGDRLPEGWKRDFVIYNVGWDKDADLNTIYGQNVEPLPFRAMKAYPYEPDQQFPTSPAHLDFLHQYQTRQQNPGLFWNQVRDAL